MCWRTLQESRSFITIYYYYCGSNYRFTDMDPGPHCARCRTNTEQRLSLPQRAYTQAWSILLRWVDMRYASSLCLQMLSRWQGCSLIQSPGERSPITWAALHRPAQSMPLHQCLILHQCRHALSCKRRDSRWLQIDMGAQRNETALISIVGNGHSTPAA